MSAFTTRSLDLNLTTACDEVAEFEVTVTDWEQVKTYSEAQLTYSNLNIEAAEAQAFVFIRHYTDAQRAMVLAQNSASTTEVELNRLSDAVVEAFKNMNVVMADLDQEF